MSYRPISDMWFLARCKYKGGVKRYGGYLAGFPERARALLGCTINSPVLHVCGGMARYYPYKRGFGPADKTLDLDPACKPDFLQDAREPLPSCTCIKPNGETIQTNWGGILIDPPYSEQDATHYPPGEDKYPSPVLLIENALREVPIGGRVGIIHYFPPKNPKNSMMVACVGVICGFNNRIRVYSVYERTGS
jgi:hypothetical protein